MVGRTVARVDRWTTDRVVAMIAARTRDLEVTVEGAEIVRDGRLMIDASRDSRLDRGNKVIERLFLLDRLNSDPPIKSTYEKYLDKRLFCTSYDLFRLKY